MPLRHQGTSVGCPVFKQGPGNVVWSESAAQMRCALILYRLPHLNRPLFALLRRQRQPCVTIAPCRQHAGWISITLPTLRPSDHPTTSTVAAANPFRRTALVRMPPLPLPIVSCSIRTSTSRWSGYFRVSTAVLLYLVETNMVAKMRRYFCLKMSCNGQNSLRLQRRIERSLQFSNSQVRYLLQRTSKTTSLYRVAKNRGLISHETNILKQVNLKIAKK